jgi:large subunit ribosomal protein L32
MAVPRNRTSNARKNSRRSHHAKQPRNFQSCSNCGNKHIPHRICPHCGFYDGRAIVNAESK